jgi:hypothetical protein
VLFEMEALRRRQSETRWWQRAWNRVLRASIGFGVYPVWAIRWLIALTILATGVFGVGYLNGSIVPGDKDANSVFIQQGAPPGYYPRFNALIYAMENTVPLLKFGQDGAWIPNPTKASRKPALSPGTFARGAAFAVKCLGWLTPPFLLVWFRWLLIIVGWILGTLFLAGVTGIVRGN